MRLHGKDGVKKKHALPCPTGQIAVFCRRNREVHFQLLIDILQRRREGNAVRHREAEAVGLPGAVVGILADDDDLQFVEGAFVEGPEDIAAARVDASRGVFLPDEIGQGDEIGFLEFGGEDLFPVGCDLYIHRSYDAVKVA